VRDAERPDRDQPLGDPHDAVADAKLDGSAARW
jgi:hypothetical protein